MVSLSSKRHIIRSLDHIYIHLRLYHMSHIMCMILATFIVQAEVRSVHLPDAGGWQWARGTRGGARERQWQRRGNGSPSQRKVPFFLPFFPALRTDKTQPFNKLETTNRRALKFEQGFQMNIFGHFCWCWRLLTSFPTFVPKTFLCCSLVPTPPRPPNVRLSVPSVPVRSPKSLCPGLDFDLTRPRRRHVCRRIPLPCPFFRSPHCSGAQKFIDSVDSSNHGRIWKIYKICRFDIWGEIEKEILIQQW